MRWEAKVPLPYRNRRSGKALSATVKITGHLVKDDDAYEGGARSNGQSKTILNIKNSFLN